MGGPFSYMQFPSCYQLADKSLLKSETKSADSVDKKYRIQNAMEQFHAFENPGAKRAENRPEDRKIKGCRYSGSRA